MRVGRRHTIAEMASEHEKTYQALEKYLHSFRHRDDADRLIESLEKVYEQCAAKLERTNDPWDMEGLDGEKIALGVGA